KSDQCELDGIASRKLLDTLSKLETVQREPSMRPLADEYGFTKQELFGLAEIAYHYLRSGGFKLAGALFEGLAAIEPREPYFALAVGLAADRLGDRKKAIASFERPQPLHPPHRPSDLHLPHLAPPLR